MELTKQEIKALECILKQTHDMQNQGLNQTKITLTCPDCGKEHVLMNMFRCFECSQYICIDCGEKHFGVKQRNIFKDRGLRKKKFKTKWYLCPWPWFGSYWAEDYKVKYTHIFIFVIERRRNG